MTEARDSILALVRRQLGRGPLSPQQSGPLEEGLLHPRRNLVPERSRLDPVARCALFVDMAREAAASIERLDHDEAVPGAVAAFLDRHQMPLRLVLGPASDLAALPWREAAISIEQRLAVSGDGAALTPAFAAIAETGTLMLVSSPQTPVTLNFLPDNHLLVLHESRIVGAMEDGWDLLRSESADMPRTVNFITGPSRSADIEQTLQMGAHGPLRVHILLLSQTRGDVDE